MVEPTYMPIIGVPVAWTSGTNGPVTGEAILAQIQTAADMEKFHGKLAGKYRDDGDAARAGVSDHGRWRAATPPKS